MVKTLVHILFRSIRHVSFSRIHTSSALQLSHFMLDIAVVCHLHLESTNINNYLHKYQVVDISTLDASIEELKSVVDRIYIEKLALFSNTRI